MLERSKTFDSTLVTGASGFIGQHLVQGLVKNGLNVNALLRNRENPGLTDKANIFKGDIFNKEVLKKAANEVDVVYHLVAKTHDLSGVDNANDYFKINVEGTRNLLDACSASKIKHFIYFSSVKTMAEESKHALDETYDCTPTTPYGESKLVAEKLVFEYGNKYSFKTTVLRLPLVYGPGNKGNVYKMIKAIDNRRFVMMGRGENRRSMISVKNVVDAAMAIVNQDIADKKIYLVTDGVDYSVKDLYRLIAKCLVKKPLQFYVPICIASLLAIAGDIASKLIRKSLPFDSASLGKLTGSLTFTSQKFENEIGFEPKYNLYNTMDETIRWYRGEKSKAEV
jgi:UDP-glucose 4-epimerase